MNRKILMVTSFLILACIVGPRAVEAQEIGQAQALSENLSSLVGTDGWCVNVSNATGATNQLAVGTAPARFTSQRLGLVRWLEILHADAASADLICFALGDDGIGNGITCDLGTSTAGVITAYGSGKTIHPRRTKQIRGVTGALPPLYVEGSTAGNVKVCFTVGF